MRSRIVVLLALVLFGCTEKSAPRSLPFYDSPDFTPRWSASTHRIRPFTLMDQDGTPFTEQDLAGKITVADFFFARCRGICPRMATSMKRIQTTFLEDDAVLLISHTVTPDDDTLEVLREYAKARGVDPRRWKLLTGARSEIYDLGRKYYFVEEDLGATKSDKDFLHTENFVLLDTQRRLRGIYNALDPDSMAALTADIAVLEREE